VNAYIICTHTYIHTYIHTNIHRYTWISISLCPRGLHERLRSRAHFFYPACMYVCMYVFMKGCEVKLIFFILHVCMSFYVCMYVCMYEFLCMYVCMYSWKVACVCIYICIYIYIYTFEYIYTVPCEFLHTHTQTYIYRMILVMCEDASSHMTKIIIYIYIYIYTLLRVLVVHMCMCVCVYIYIYIYDSRNTWRCTALSAFSSYTSFRSHEYKHMAVLRVYIGTFKAGDSSAALTRKKCSVSLVNYRYECMYACVRLCT
jgi:hypothetical protein